MKVIDHATQIFNVKGTVMNMTKFGIVPENIAVRYSIDRDGYTTVSFSDDKNTMIHIIVNNRFKEMCKEIINGAL